MVMQNRGEAVAGARVEVGGDVGDGGDVGVVRSWVQGEGPVIGVLWVKIERLSQTARNLRVTCFYCVHVTCTEHVLSDTLRVLAYALHVLSYTLIQVAGGSQGALQRRCNDVATTLLHRRCAIEVSLV